MTHLITKDIEFYDNRILDFCSLKLKNRYFDRLMPIITHCNDYGAIYVFLICSLMLLKVRTDIATKLIVALALGFLLGEGLIKHLIVRNRPIYHNSDCKSLVKIPKTSSFLSGHTTSSFAVFSVFWGLDSSFGYVFLIIAILIAFSRMYLYLHYPTDILGGMLLGIFCGKLVFTLYNSNYIIHIVGKLVSIIMYIH